MLDDISSIRLRDLEIFDEVARSHSIRGVARKINSTSGQVSKAIQNLERLVGTKLFRRSATGVLLTSQGTELQEIVRDVLASGQRIGHLISDRHKKSSRSLAVAGTSFLNTHFTSAIICRAFAEPNGTVFRFLDLPPDQMVAVGLRGGFDLAVHFGNLHWPGTWISNRLGKSRWTLCARKGHPLARKTTLRQILDYAFIAPTYWTAEGLARGNDQFPIPLSKRKLGFETSTADAAVPILLETDQIAFLPELLVRPHIEAGKLKEIRSNELGPVEKELYLSAKADAVSAAIFARLTKEMSGTLN